MSLTNIIKFGLQINENQSNLRKIMTDIETQIGALGQQRARLFEEEISSISAEEFVKLTDFVPNNYAKEYNFKYGDKIEATLAAFTPKVEIVLAPKGVSIIGYLNYFPAQPDDLKIYKNVAAMILSCSSNVLKSV